MWKALQKGLTITVCAGAIAAAVALGLNGPMVSPVQPSAAVQVPTTAEASAGVQAADSEASNGNAPAPRQNAAQDSQQSHDGRRLRSGK